MSESHKIVHPVLTNWDYQNETKWFIRGEDCSGKSTDREGTIASSLCFAVQPTFWGHGKLSFNSRAWPTAQDLAKWEFLVVQCWKSGYDKMLSPNCMHQNIIHGQKPQKFQKGKKDSLCSLRSLVLQYFIHCSPSEIFHVLLPKKNHLKVRANKLPYSKGFISYAYLTSIYGIIFKIRKNNKNHLK